MRVRRVSADREDDDRRGGRVRRQLAAVSSVRARSQRSQLGVRAARAQRLSAFARFLLARHELLSLQPSHLLLHESPVRSAPLLAPPHVRVVRRVEAQAHTHTHTEKRTHARALRGAPRRRPTTGCAIAARNNAMRSTPFHRMTLPRPFLVPVSQMCPPTSARCFSLINKRRTEKYCGGEALRTVRERRESVRCAAPPNIIRTQNSTHSCLVFIIVQ